MKRLKQWFHNTVLAEVHKILDRIIGEYQRVIEAHILSVFNNERRALQVILETAKDDLKLTANVLHGQSLARLGEETFRKMEAELKAFEARVQHTLEATIKEAPAHWRADEEALKVDIELRTPKR